MYKDKNIIYIKAITPVHAGCGQEISSVDMPIQRERHSNIPKIEGSSLKGSIRHWIQRKIDINKNDEKGNFEYVFGPEDGSEFASKIVITDASLLFFPIKSNVDVFKLVTCPYLLGRWIEACNIYSNKKYESLDIKLNDGEILIFKIDENNKCQLNEDNIKIFLEEYIFTSINNRDCNKIVEVINEECKEFDTEDLEKIAIISDSAFIDLVNMYTEIITRNKIDVETGTAAGTALFTEEYLPTETIMYFTVMTMPDFKVSEHENPMNYFYTRMDKIFQVGGNSTIGKGFVKVLNPKESKIEEN